MDEPPTKKRQILRLEKIIIVTERSEKEQTTRKKAV